MWLQGLKLAKTWKGLLSAEDRADRETRILIQMVLMTSYSFILDRESEVG